MQTLHWLRAYQLLSDSAPCSQIWLLVTALILVTYDLFSVHLSWNKLDGRMLSAETKYSFHMQRKTHRLLYSIAHTETAVQKEVRTTNIIAYKEWYLKQYSLTEILTKFLRPYSLLMDTQHDSNHSRFSKFLMVLNTFWNCIAIFDNKTTCRNTTEYFVVCT